MPIRQAADFRPGAADFRPVGETAQVGSGGTVRELLPRLLLALLIAACSGVYDDDTAMPGDDDTAIPGDDDATGAGNDGLFVSQVVPAGVEAGGAFDVEITMQNTGTTTWSQGEDYRLGSLSPQDNDTWGTQRILMDEGATTATGESYTFTTSLTAPAAHGTHDFQWGMVHEHVEWFGEATSLVAVESMDCTGHCYDGAHDCGEDDLDCGGECIPCEGAVLLSDALTSAAGCTGVCHERTHVGEDDLYHGDGWHQETADARVVYDIGVEMDCGVMEFTLTNFDPLTQVFEHGGIDEYHPLWRITEDEAGVRCDPDWTTIHMQVVRYDGQDFDRHERLRLSGWAACDGGANRYTDRFEAWDTSHVYRLRLEWNNEQTTLTGTDQTSGESHDVTVDLSFPEDDPDPTLNQRWLLLGRDNCDACGQDMTGPIWRDLVVMEREGCE